MIGQRTSCVLGFLLLFPGVLIFTPTLQGQDPVDRWKRTGSPESYIHHIELRDERGQVISRDDDSGRLPHMGETCAPCHDMSRAAGGLHGGGGPAGPPGEPWFLVDSRSATRWPFHSRSWAGLATPADLGLEADELLQRFGTYDTGGIHSMTGQSSDCLICHLPDGYDFHRRSTMLAQGNTRLAAFVAAGLYEPSGKPIARFWDESDKLTLNLKADAGPTSCLHCHSSKPAAEDRDRPRWSHADDVHIAAGMSCVDCHRAGIDHHVVRGKSGETHPSGTSVKSLSCRGCHLPSGEPVMHSAPRPGHRGLPSFHLDELSCTACHSGPSADQLGEKSWTSRAHRLGIPKQGRSAQDPPSVFSGVLLIDDQGRWAPHHQVWPEGWIEQDQSNKPGRVLSPGELRRPLRQTLRVRSDLLETIRATTEDPSRAERSISVFLGQLDPPAALVTAGSSWHMAPGDFLQSKSSEFAEPYEWKIGHPVRPTSMSLGSSGCTDCHSTDSKWPLLESNPDILIPIQSANGSSLGTTVDQNSQKVFQSALWNLWKPIFPGRDIAKLYFVVCAFLASAAAVRRFLIVMSGDHR